MRAPKLHTIVGGIAALFTLSACVGVSSQIAVPHFQVTPLKGDPRVTISATRQILLIDIVSPTGIGGVEIDKTSGEWPPKITMRFHLKGLEDLQFAYGDKVVKVSVSSNGSGAVQESVIISGKEMPIAQDSPYWMNVTILAKDGTPGEIPLQDGTIEVDAPADFLQSGLAKFTTQWIDFYR